MGRLPTFLIIGAQKSGTTSLFLYLREHPQVYMSSLKEPDFFVNEGKPHTDRSLITTFEEYSALFADAKDETAVGEASPTYLHGETAPERIAHYLPHAQLIAILRNPADRAYSHWLHNSRNGRETLDFQSALLAEDARMKNGLVDEFGYRHKGEYHRHLERFYRLFGRTQIRAYLYEDLKESPQAMVKDLFGFLGVKDTFQPRLERHNVSGLPRGRAGRLYDRARRNPRVTKIAKQILPGHLRHRLRQRLLVRPELPAEFRAGLVEFYRDDIKRLEDLILRDLSSWRQEPHSPGTKEMWG